AFSLVLIRLIWDLMFATKEPFQVRLDPVVRLGSEGTRHSGPGYQQVSTAPKPAGVLVGMGLWRLRIDPTRGDKRLKKMDPACPRPLPTCRSRAVPTRR